MFESTGPSRQSLASRLLHLGTNSPERPSRRPAIPLDVDERVVSPLQLVRFGSIVINLGNIRPLMSDLCALQPSPGSTSDRDATLPRSRIDSAPRLHRLQRESDGSPSGGGGGLDMHNLRRAGEMGYPSSRATSTASVSSVRPRTHTSNPTATGSRLNSMRPQGSTLIDQQLANTLRRLESRHMAVQESLLQRGSTRGHPSSRSSTGAETSSNEQAQNQFRSRGFVARSRASMHGAFHWGRSGGASGVGGGSTTGASIGALFDDDDFIFGVDPFRPFEGFADSIAANPLNYLVSSRWAVRWQEN
jgi:hypothetical protein